MSGKLATFRKRLAKVEQQLASRMARREKRLNCNCRSVTVADANKPQEFEAEMNRSCPSHEFRRLGEIVRVGTPGGKQSAKLELLLQIYDTSLSPPGLATSLQLARLRLSYRELQHESREV